jgi:uncharacterized protein (DUF2126 family)
MALALRSDEELVWQQPNGALTITRRAGRVHFWHGHTLVISLPDDQSLDLANAIVTVNETEGVGVMEIKVPVEIEGYAPIGIALVTSAPITPAPVKRGPGRPRKVTPA